MDRFFPALLLSFALAPAALRAQEAAPRPAYGILLLSHGNGPRWDEPVRSLGAQIDKRVPTETAFGMFIGAADVGAVQKAVDRLEARGVDKIVAVPLFINSDSEVMDQARYEFGLAEQPSKTLEQAMKAGMPGMDMGPGRRVKTAVPLVLAPALDDHPLLADILLSRAKALSRDPSRETVILVGHGPVEDAKNEVWLKTMDRLGRTVKKKGGFEASAAATLRDDASPAVKEKAAILLRAFVEKADDDGGRALVVPLLLSAGGIEDHVKSALAGTSYAWDGKMLLPDPRLAQWVLETGGAGAAQPDERKYK